MCRSVDKQPTSQVGGKTFEGDHTCRKRNTVCQLVSHEISKFGHYYLWNKGWRRDGNFAKLQLKLRPKELLGRRWTAVSGQQSLGCAAARCRRLLQCGSGGCAQSKLVSSRNLRKLQLGEKLAGPVLSGEGGCGTPEGKMGAPNCLPNTPGTCELHAWQPVGRSSGHGHACGAASCMRARHGGGGLSCEVCEKW